jgi:serine/threonine-protein kinase
VSPAALAHDLVLGRYRPLRPLGSGGMGHVWLARDEESGLDVALKIVPREGKAAARAEREAAAAAALRHPRCQRIYALARDPGHVYIAYEYVPGRTLRETIRAGELDDRAAVEAAAQVCDALAHAHGRGIVHRDVKPSNILLAESGAGVHRPHSTVDVRLLDFGLAQMAEFDTLTAHGDVPGTLAYVSPERLRGESATPAADVWAVGVILWEALAGHHPFWEGGTSGTSSRIHQGGPPLEQVRPDLPVELRRVVASALFVDAARRPSASELARQLRELPRKRQMSRWRDRTRTPPRTRVANAARDRLVPATLAAVTSGWVASTLPFYPERWPLGIALAAAVLGFAAPRAGLSFALASVFFPLANISLGLAIAYAVLALAWLGLCWRDARSGLILVAGPLLAPIAALALVPLVSQVVRGRVRRAVQAAAAVLAAAVVAGLRGLTLPFDRASPPLGLGIAGSDDPTAVGLALWDQLVAHPVLVGEAAVAAAAAALLPSVRGRGPWAAAAFGGSLLAAVCLAAPDAPFLPIAAAAWATAAVLALEPTN